MILPGKLRSAALVAISPGTPCASSDHCLSYANFGESVWRFKHRDEKAEVGVSRQVSTNEATALPRAALACGVVALQPTYLASPHRADGGLPPVSW